MKLFWLIFWQLGTFWSLHVRENLNKRTILGKLPLGDSVRNIIANY